MVSGKYWAILLAGSMLWSSLTGCSGEDAPTADLREEEVVVEEVALEEIVETDPSVTLYCSITGTYATQSESAAKEERVEILKVNVDQHTIELAGAIYVYEVSDLQYYFTHSGKEAALSAGEKHWIETDFWLDRYTLDVSWRRSREIAISDSEDDSGEQDESRWYTDSQGACEVADPKI
jgi:hypothetical protein